MSYLIENEAENLQNGDTHLAQIPDFEMEYLKNSFGELRSVMARFFSFFMLFHELNFFELNELNSFELNFFLTGGAL